MNYTNIYDILCEIVGFFQKNKDNLAKYKHF